MKPYMNDLIDLQFVELKVRIKAWKRLVLFKKQLKDQNKKKASYSSKLAQELRDGGQRLLNLKDDDYIFMRCLISDEKGS